jgi:2'-5' RNA ligase
LAGAAIEGRWDVPEVVLYRSLPGPGGHRYEVLHRVALRA